MAYTVKLTIDSVLTDVSAHVVNGSIQRSQVLHNDLKSASDQAGFALKKTTPKAIVNALMATTTYVGVVIQKNGSDYFTGILTENYRTRLLSFGFDSVKIECEDFTDYKLNVPWVSANNVATQWLNCDICNPSVPASSIIHKVAALAGLTVSGSVPAVAITIDYFVVADKDGATYTDILNGLLYEHGYSFGFNLSGAMVLHNLNVPNTTTTKAFKSTGNLATDNMIGQLEIAKSKRNYRYFDVKWFTWKQMDNLVVFSDTTGATDTYKCVIPVPGDGYYPSGATATIHVYGDYKLQDGTKVLMVGSVSSNIVKDAALSIINADNLYTSCHLKIKNTDQVMARNITTLELIGTGIIVQDAENHTTAGSLAGNKRLNIDSKYLHTSTRAKEFADLLANYYQYAAYSYSVKSKTDYEIGDIVQIQDSNYSGINIYAKIIKKENTENGNGIIQYTLYGVSAYAAGLAVTVPTNNTSQTNNAGAAITFNTAPQRIVDLANGGVIPQNGTVKPNGQIVSSNYAPGLAGFAIAGSGNAEFNAITIRGTIYATAGKIANWLIGADKLASSADGTARAEMDRANMRFTVVDSADLPKTAMGYLGGLKKNGSPWQPGRAYVVGEYVWYSGLTYKCGVASPVGALPTNTSYWAVSTDAWTASDYGFWAAAGNALKIDGGVSVENGDWIIGHDASFQIKSGSTVVARLGTLNGAIGIHLNEGNTGGNFRAKMTASDFFVGNDSYYLRFQGGALDLKLSTFTTSSAITGITSDDISLSGRTKILVLSGANLTLDKSGGASIQFTRSGTDGMQIDDDGSGNMRFIAGGTTPRWFFNANGSLGMTRNLTVGGSVINLGYYDHPIEFAQIDTGAGGYAPAMRMRSRISSGYIMHTSIGQYRTGSSWQGGLYVASGGDDAHPTEFWLFRENGILQHSVGYIYVLGELYYNGGQSIAPRPNGSSGAVGEFKMIIGTTNLLAPAGGTWACFWMDKNASGNVISSGAGVFAGGAVLRNNWTGYYFEGFAWRVS